jgi:hypothetical protein
MKVIGALVLVGFLLLMLWGTEVRPPTLGDYMGFVLGALAMIVYLVPGVEEWVRGVWERLQGKK